MGMPRTIHSSREEKMKGDPEAKAALAEVVIEAALEKA